MQVLAFSPARLVGLAATASMLFGLLFPRQERPALYSFETLDKGLNSGFGEHCWDRRASSIGSGPGRVRAKILLPRTPSGPCFAEVARPAFEAIFRSECAWLDFWQEHTLDDPDAVPAFVDFGRYVVLAVIKGPTSGCSGIEIAGISRGPGDTRRVHVRQEVPCDLRDCLALSNAYHFVLVPAEFLPQEAAVAFVHDEPVPDGITMHARRP
jgi:hypothetical protein